MRLGGIFRAAEA
jgi:hypothetical protein